MTFHMSNLVLKHPADDTLSSLCERVSDSNSDLVFFFLNVFLGILRHLNCNYVGEKSTTDEKLSN